MATQNSIGTTIPIPVTQGGTGVTTIAPRQSLMGNGTAALGSIIGQSNGRPLTGSTGAAPVYAALLSGSTTRTLGENSLNIDLFNFAANTFTPGMNFGGNAVGMTGTFTGYYMQIMSTVFFQLEIVLTAKGSSTGFVNITGMPVTASTLVNFMYDCYVSNTSFITAVHAYLVVNTKTLNLYNVKTGTVTPLSETNLTDTTVIRISGSYLA